MRTRLLVVQNSEWEGPGLVGLYARAAGLEVAKAELFGARRRRAAGILDGVEKGEFAAVVSLGSPSTAYVPESDAGRDLLVRLFRDVRRHRVPSFNVCYSMQLFSLVHGGRVVRNPLGREVGFRRVLLTEEGGSDPVFGPVGDHTALQWHGDMVESLPPGALRLGYSDKTRNQLASLDGLHYLVQGDGQASLPGMVRSWLRHDSKWATSGTGADARELVSQAVEREALFRSTFLRVFGGFVSLAIAEQR